MKHHYKITETRRSGFQMFNGVLMSEQGEIVGRVESWSTAGCLTALRAMARHFANCAV